MNPGKVCAFTLQLISAPVNKEVNQIQDLKEREEPPLMDGRSLEDLRLRQGKVAANQSNTGVDRLTV